MKNYRITVNGVAYDVSVEELGAGEAPAVSAPVAAATKAPAKKAPAKVAGAEGSVKVNAPMPGKIVAVKAKAGDSVKKGDVVIVLEAMKMENEIMSPRDGVVAGVHVAKGDSVDSGKVLVSLQ